MCGRYALASSPELLAEFFDTPWSDPAPALFNISPQTWVPVLVLDDEGKRAWQWMRWSIPLGSGTARPIHLFNVRAESVKEKSFAQTLIQKTRCILPASAYYEWQPEGNAKVPWRMDPAEGPFLAFAGVWKKFFDTSTGEERKACAILTCPATPAIRHLHDRMPLVLPSDIMDNWLNSSEGIKILKKALELYPRVSLKFCKVNTKVGNSRLNAPEFLFGQLS